jgi:hypothetical protein
MKINLLAFSLALICGGCVTAPPPAPLPTAMTFSAPKNTVWPLLVAQIGLDYPVKIAEKDSGLITTEMVNIPFSSLDNGSTTPTILLGIWDGSRMSLNAMAVESEPGKTTVTIRAHYEAFESNVTKSWVTCDSNGHLENEILTRIQSQVH